MSRTPHPLAPLAAPFTVEAETWRECNSPTCGIRWRVTLSNEHGDTYIHEGHYPTIPQGNSAWFEFWKGVNNQLSWEKQLLTAAPIVRSIRSDNLAQWISWVNIAKPYWMDDVVSLLQNSDQPELEGVMQKLDLGQFAAVQHLAKKRLMQIP